MNYSYKIKFIENLVPYFREFGIKFSTVYLMDAMLKKYSHRHHHIRKYLRKDFANIDLENDIPECKLADDFNIWVLWWQGEEKMPPIIKICYTYLINHCKGYEVNLITKYNYDTYIDLPSNILKKFKNGNMTITDFSDICRLALLDKYGGLWIDSTVLLTDDIIKYPLIYTERFFSLKFAQMDTSFFEVSYGRWSVYLMGSAYIHYPLYNLALRIYYKYWNEHDIAIDYFLTDFIFDYLYEHSNMIKEDIDHLPINNKNHLELAHIMENKYNETFYEKLLSDCIFHKLTRKQSWDFTNQDTFLGHIIKDMPNEK